MTISVTHHVVNAAEQLMCEVENRRREVDEAFGDGYQTGFLAGERVGYERAHAEMHTAWVALAQKIRDIARVPTAVETAHRRRTAAGEAYEAARKRRGGCDYSGGPIPWEST